MSIFDKLKFSGMSIGNVQSVDEMTVVPIIGGDLGNVASPDKLVFKRTATYGTMVFENTDNEKPAIVPANYMVRGPGAQDHAMTSSGVILKKASHNFDTACCIEQSQGGYLSSQGNVMDVLPISLRKDILNKSLRSTRDYSKLWPRIKDWLNGIALQRRGSAHLRYFYDDPSVKDELENFAAEFEPVENQIGAIIMFAGVPVGIEIMPTAEHWDAYWKLLIRGCYGAELLRLKFLKKIKTTALILPEIPKDATIEEVSKYLDEFSEHLKKEVLPLLDNIQIKSISHDSKDGNLQTSVIKTTSGGGGDLIQEGDKPIYLSIVL